MILLTMILCLPIIHAFADDIYYWNISNMRGVVYSEESISIAGEGKIETSNRRGGGGTVKCETSLLHLTVKDSVIDGINDKEMYCMKFYFVNAEWEGFDSIIDKSEFDLMLAFLDEKAGWHYNSCDGTSYELNNGSDGLVLKVRSNNGYYFFTDANEIIPYLIERLTEAKKETEVKG